MGRDRFGAREHDFGLRGVDIGDLDAGGDQVALPRLAAALASARLCRRGLPPRSDRGNGKPKTHDQQNGQDTENRKAGGADAFQPAGTSDDDAPIEARRGLVRPAACRFKGQITLTSPWPGPFRP